MCVKMWHCFHGRQLHRDSRGRYALRGITINGKHWLVKHSRSLGGLELGCLEWLLTGKQKRNWSKTQRRKWFTWFGCCGLRSPSDWFEKKKNINKIVILTLSSPIRGADTDGPTRMDNHRLNVLSLAQPRSSTTINVSGSHQPRASERASVRSALKSAV